MSSKRKHDELNQDNNNNGNVQNGNNHETNGHDDKRLKLDNPNASNEPVVSDKVKQLKARIEARKLELQKQKEQLPASIANQQQQQQQQPIEQPIDQPIQPTTATTTTTTTTTTTAIENAEPNLFFDPRLGTSYTGKKSRINSFMMHKPGKYSKMGDKIRSKAIQEELEKKKLLIDSNSDQVVENPNDLVMMRNYISNEVPDIETWDLKLFSKQLVNSNEIEKSELIDKYLQSSNPDQCLNKPDTWSYVYHPIQIPSIEKLLKNNIEEDSNIELKGLYLLTEERRKLRIKNRAEKREEQRERILNGIQETPEQKVRIKNLMKVMLDRGTIEPTKVLEMVQQKAQERMESHLRHNDENKLTKEERKEKKINKILDDASNQLYCVIFKLVDLSHPLYRSKVFSVAKGFLATGCIIYHHLMNLVIVEAGAKSIKQFKKLMCQRIDWANRPPDKQKPMNVDETQEEKEDKQPKPEELVPPVTDRVNECKLIWEGPIVKSNFKNFTYQAIPLESKARKFLQDHSVPHYWDMAKSVNF